MAKYRRKSPKIVKKLLEKQLKISKDHQKCRKTRKILRETSKNRQNTDQNVLELAKYRQNCPQTLKTEKKVKIS